MANHCPHQPGAGGGGVVDVVLAPILPEHIFHISEVRLQNDLLVHIIFHISEVRFQNDLLVHRPLVVAVNHPVDPEHIRLVLLHHALGLQYKSRPAFQENSNDGCFFGGTWHFGDGAS